MAWIWTDMMTWISDWWLWRDWKLTCGIFERAILSGIFGDIKLRQFNVRIGNQRVGNIPFEHQILGSMRHWKAEKEARISRAITIIDGWLSARKKAKFLILTTLDLHVANLSIVRIRFKLHGARQHQSQSLKTGKHKELHKTRTTRQRMGVTYRQPSYK